MRCLCATASALSARDLGGRRLWGVGRLGHGAGSAMVMKRGDVGWYDVDVWRVSCSVGVGSRYSIASQRALGMTFATM